MDPLTRNSRDLSAAELADLLLYGLTLDPDDVLAGVLAGIQNELKLIALLMLGAPPMMEFGGVELSTTLELLARRLETACEMMRRARSENASSPGNDMDKGDPPGEP